MTFQLVHRIKSLIKWILFISLMISVSIYFIIRGSLPDLSGEKLLTHLDNAVVVERDALGIATITAKTRAETALALGYVHAQERFFQMDLLRRSAAGELAGLFGDGAIPSDTHIKIHRFRERARYIVQKLPKQHYDVLTAYTQGVNDGIQNLSLKPYQYLLLQQDMMKWEPEDSVLCIFAMYLDLNDAQGYREQSLAILNEQLPSQWLDFLLPQGGYWDAPLDNSQVKIPQQIPSRSLLHDFINEAQVNINYQRQPLVGSNGWSVAGALTSYESAMLANDIHLKLGVPNIWFRASWFTENGRRVTGVTLPGTPAMVAGSNGQVAWGYTNSYGNWGDIKTLKLSDDGQQYNTPQGWADFKKYKHTIRSNTGKTKEHTTFETLWGPVIGKNHMSQKIAHQWVAYEPDAINLKFLDLETTSSVQDALSVAHQMRLPPQNLMLADAKGQIAWTIAGSIPNRINLPNGWHQVYRGTDYPNIVNPENHRLWTANNRVLGGDEGQKVDFEGFDLGARATQIRNGLLAKQQFSEIDLLTIQLDNRSHFLQRWLELMLQVVSQDNNSTHQSEFQLITNVLSQEQDLYASADSVAYGLVRKYRTLVVNKTIGWIFDSFKSKYPKHFKRDKVDHLSEYTVWHLIADKPDHLVPQGYSDWNEFLQIMAVEAYQEITEHGKKDIAEQSWGSLHKVTILHPLSQALPGLASLLNMPKTPLNGDDNMPKILGSDFGASMRMVVAPGHEDQGILHMPAGQSSHPLSSYYANSHDDWLSGKPSAFLPGETKWTLTLMPAQ